MDISDAWHRVFLITDLHWSLVPGGAAIGLARAGAHVIVIDVDEKSAAETSAVTLMLKLQRKSIRER